MTEQFSTLAGLYPVAVAPQGQDIKEIAMSTGWPELDEIYRPYPGQFNVVTGKPGHGKSTFLFNLAMNLAVQCGKRVFFYVPENERRLRYKLRRIFRGTEDEWRVLSHENLFVQSSDWRHYSDAPKTLPWVLDACQTAIDIKGVDLCIVDPWNELERAKPKDSLLVDYIGKCLQEARIFSDVTQTTFYITVHPTKAANERDANMGDCEGGNVWWAKADNGLVVKRDGAATVVEVHKVRERGAGKIGGKCYFDVDENERFQPQYGASG